MDLYVNDDAGRTTEFEIVLGSARWSYEVECNGERFTVTTAPSPAPEDILEAVLDAYQEVRAQTQAHATRIREELDHGVI